MYKMKTLKEYNKERTACYEEIEKWAKNPVAGILCDDCAEKGEEVEMIYEYPGQRHLSHPPTSWVICPKCGKRALKTH